MARPRPDRRRDGLIWAAAASVLFHALLLVVVARHLPPLLRDNTSAGPPLPVLPVVLAAPTPPTAAGAKPEPLRLHRRRVRGARPEFVPPPDPVPAAPPPTPRPPPPRLHPAPLPEGPTADVRRALRTSPVGCADRDRLSRAEREACDEALGRGARAIPPLPVGSEMSPSRRNELDAQAARREAQVTSKARPIPGGALEAGGSGQPWERRPAPGPVRGPLKP